jgi:beta-galactosidase
MITSLLETICNQSGVSPILLNVPSGVEVTKRENENGEFLFLLNHTNVDQNVDVKQASADVLSDELFTGLVNLNAGEVRVLRLQ